MTADLPDEFPWELVRCEILSVDTSESIAMPAQRAERGSKSATIVIEIVPASGNESTVTYWRIANIAVRGVSRQVILLESIWLLTRDYHGAASHCSQNSDTTPLLPAIAPTSVEGEE